MPDPIPVVEISPLAPIFEGEDVSAIFVDGTQALLFVPQYKIRKIPEFMAVVDNECAMLERVCTLSPRASEGTPALPSDWIDRLSDASHAELVEKARALNLERALVWAERQTRVYQRLRPLSERVSKG